MQPLNRIQTIFKRLILIDRLLLGGISQRRFRSAPSVATSSQQPPHRIRLLHSYSHQIIMSATAPQSSPSPIAPTPIQTQYWHVRPDGSPVELESQLGEAARLLQQDQLVAFPTETVYGLGGNALSTQALRGIYTAKGRPSDNPLIVHVHSHQQFLSLGRDIPKLALQLAERFWPGPLTIIIPTAHGAQAACETARAGLDCVGVRMPSHPVALALLRVCGVPLAAPSANLSGRPSPTTAKHVSTDLDGRIAGIIDGGSADGVGLESTVVECVDGINGELGWVTILRPGGVTREQLEEVAGKGRVRLDPAIERHMTIATEPIQSLPKQTQGRTKEVASVDTLLSPSSSSSPSPSITAATSSSPSDSTKSNGPKAPGMKYTHYAPRAPILLVDGSIQFLLATAEPYLKHGDIVGILGTEESRASITAFIASHPEFTSDQIEFIPCGHRSDLSTVARELYGALRAFDNTNVQVILSEIFPSDGVGEAIMNRLNKAAGGQGIKEQPNNETNAKLTRHIQPSM